MFDPRLTEEYQQAGLPYSFQGADGELAAMDIGASLWATGTRPARAAPPSPRRVTSACRWGYLSLYFETDSPMFHLCKATGLTVTDWQEAILVDQIGQRFWNELDSSYEFINAAMGYNGDKTKLNGGGPIWAIFDADAVARQKWKPKPPHVDPDGYFASADTIFELAGRIKNPYQKQPMSGAALQETVNRYNSFVTVGRRCRLQQATPMHKIEKPPFYAAWSTPILHEHADRAAHRHPRAGDRHSRRGDPGTLLRRRIAGRLCPAWARALPGVRPHRRPPCGATEFVRRRIVTDHDRRSASRCGTCRCRWSRAKRSRSRSAQSQRPAGRWPGTRIEVIDATGAVVASGTLGDAPLPEPRRCTGPRSTWRRQRSCRSPSTPCGSPRDGAAATRFSVAVAAMPVHTLAVTVTERDSKAALDSVEIRLGAFHARTEQGRPCRTARRAGRLSASALAHRAHRAGGAARHQKRRHNRIDHAARAGGSPGRAVGAVSNYRVISRNPTFGDWRHTAVTGAALTDELPGGDGRASRESAMPVSLFYSAATRDIGSTASTLAAQNLNSGILPNGSSFGLVSRFAAAST